VRALAAGGTVTPAERAQLEDLRKALGLEESEVRDVEAKYQLKAAAPVTPTGPPAPRAEPKLLADKPPRQGATSPAGAPPQAPTAKTGIGGTASKPKN
jgi:hypothetical protein